MASTCYMCDTSNQFGIGNGISHVPHMRFLIWETVMRVWWGCTREHTVVENIFQIQPYRSRASAERVDVKWRWWWWWWSRV